MTDQEKIDALVAMLSRARSIIDLHVRDHDPSEFIEQLDELVQRATS